MAGVGLHEWVALLLSFCALAVLILNISRLNQIPFSNKFLAAFFAFLSGSIATVAEHFIWPYGLNVIEHVSYLANGIFLLWWCFKLELAEFREDDQ